MIVSWNWLKRYLPLEMSADELATRFSLSGLNHESTEVVFDDLAIDLEVTSNRPDCLGHIGVAREASVLYDLPLSLPNPKPIASGPGIQSLASLSIECLDLCPRYTARLIQGVKVGPSPKWLSELLRNRSGKPLEFKSINNVADITNFVMMECGQPLHAFDFSQISGSEIVVRRAIEGESLEAIDHNRYTLKAGMCVIADQAKPLALAGIMGGKGSEIDTDTTSVLIEAADFSPMSIRDTSRQLKLGSESSYRFERTVDPEGIDWASRRCCELILELCGGTLCEGVIEVGAAPAEPPAVTLRLSQVQRVLGISIDPVTVVRILTALGNTVVQQDQASIQFQTPSWRRDLSREVDLIEEVARIHGYDQIPEDRDVPMAVSVTPAADVAVGRIRRTLTACGFNEALSPSLVPPEISELYSPWSKLPAMITSQPMSGVLDSKFWNTAGPVHCVRRSLIPSLLELRRINEYRHSEPVELFEIAKAYLANPGGFPHESTLVGLCSGRDLLSVKSVVMSMADALNHQLAITVNSLNDPFFAPGKAIQLCIDGEVIGLLGEISTATQKKLKMRNKAVVGEIQLAALTQAMQLIPQSQRQSPYPAIERDLNFIVDSAVRWADIQQTVQAAGGRLLENVQYRETFVDAKRDGEGKKRVLLAVTIRSASTTLTGRQADEVCNAIIGSCDDKLGAKLVTA